MIQHEREFNRAVADGNITEEKLIELLEAIAETNRQLRYVHLTTHLETPQILSPEQIHLYNKLRGYESDVSGSHNPTEHHGH